MAWIAYALWVLSLFAVVWNEMKCERWTDCKAVERIPMIVYCGSFYWTMANRIHFHQSVDSMFHSIFTSFDVDRFFWWFILSHHVMAIASKTCLLQKHIISSFRQQRVRPSTTKSNKMLFNQLIVSGQLAHRLVRICSVNIYNQPFVHR